MHDPKPAITMAIAPRLLLLAALLVMQATPGRAFSDADLIDGFNRTVFGSEYPTWGWQSSVVKKFVDPARVYVDDRSGMGRGAEAARFISSLPGLIQGLDLQLVDDSAEANFHVFILDRASYRQVVTSEIYDRRSSAFAPGKCLVRVVSSRNGIQRTDSVIVADEGEFLFRRCLVEEVLQGLGPTNDDGKLAESVFNDGSRHETFTAFDRHILNMLYHPAIRAGMTRAQVRRILPAVAAEVRGRLR
jgi:hypothetical protein